MSQTILDKILEEVDLLSTDEQRRLRDCLDQRLSISSMSEEEFARQLEREGKVTLPKRDPAQLNRPRLPPIEIVGEPLSETIIRERR